jgi:hypothetical protein
MNSAQSDKYALAAQEDRSAHRVRLTIPATIRPAGANKFQTVVRDLSISGFSATAISRIPIKTACWLTLPGMDSLQARVVWWEQGLMGCAFERLLVEHAYESVLKRWQTGAAYGIER